MPDFFTLTEMCVLVFILPQSLASLTREHQASFLLLVGRKKIIFMIHISTYHLFPKKNVTNVFSFPPEEYPKIFRLV